MITTNRKVIGNCTYCGASGLALAALTDGPRTGLCGTCYDRAGDENAVSDGHLTCAEFQSRYDGDHSEYCDCAPKVTTYAITLTQDDLRHLVALAVREADASEDGRMSAASLDLLMAVNKGTVVA